jgi:hypothetical protein
VTKKKQKSIELEGQQKGERGVKKKLQSWASLMLAVTLLFTLMPVLPAAAADEDGARFFYFDGISSESDRPTPENRGTVDISGTYSGIVPNSITYNIQRIEDQGLPSGEGSKPVVDEAANTFRLVNVKLYSGVNKITISGVNNLGKSVSKYGYIKYTDAPAIYEVSLNDGTVLPDPEVSTEPVITTRQTISISVKAANSNKSMTVNGVSMFAGGGDSYYSAGIRLKDGANQLVIVARSDSKEQTIVRQIVYHPAGGITLYKPQFAGNNIGNSEVITSNEGTLSGEIIVDKDNTATQAIIELYSPNNKQTPMSSETINLIPGSAIKNGDSIRYRFSTTTSITLPVNGEYILKVIVGSKNRQIPFTFRSDGSPVIQEIYRLLPDGNGFTESKFPEGGSLTVSELPLYISVTTRNGGELKLRSTAAANGLVYDKQTINGRETFVINTLPSGEQSLIIELYNGAELTDSRILPITFLSAPFIEVDELYNNKVFKDPASEFTMIKGRVVNFNPSSIIVKVNGTSETVDVTNGHFNVTKSQKPDLFNLLPGPNKITLTTKDGTPKTEFTVLYFNNNASVIKNITPFVNSMGVPNPGSNIDKEVFRETGSLQYSTYEKSLGLTFSVEDTDEITVNLSHPSSGLYAAFIKDGVEWRLTGGKLLSEITGNNPSNYYTIIENGKEVIVVLNKIELPKTGIQAVTISSRLQSTSTSETVEFTREVPDALLLSPKLPQESVVKQNFVMVSILADGADEILIGKEKMVKSSKNSGIFRLEVKNLKKGKNTIKYTIVSGEEKKNKSFNITYSNEVSEGAQYKSSLSKSGKVSVFDGNLVLNVPKGTVLRQALGGEDAPTINLFDERNIIFGIANPVDGRTIKEYNRVGEVSNEEEQDGRLDFIRPNTGIQSMLHPVDHFGYASNLYWVDAGYFDNINEAGIDLDKYELTEADHPYSTRGTDLMQRLTAKDWMEPTQPGTITLKYDGKLVNSASNNLGIGWLNPINNTWVNLGGKVDAKKKTVTAPFNGFGYYAVMSLRYSYDDVIAHKTARADIELMLARGIMKASYNNNFGVFDEVTRGEFATLLVKALNIPLDYDTDVNKLTFDDIGDTITPLWDYRYIETAARKGIIRGTGPKVFGPNAVLTREEAANILARAMNLKLGDIEKDKTSLQKQFTDTNTIRSNYSYPAILAITKAGIITGIANSMKEGEKKPTYRFDPDRVLTRADTATIVKRMMAKLKIL